MFYTPTMMMMMEEMPYAFENVLAIIPYEPYMCKRKQYGWRRKPSLFFRTDMSQGILLTDALHGQSQNLQERHEPILEGCGDKVSYHIHIRGYSAFRCQKYSYSQKHGTKYPNTRAKVARQVAEAVQDFIEKRQYEQHGDEWRIGPGHIELKDLYLLELRHVAIGCFQPILGILRPAPPPPPYSLV